MWKQFLALLAAIMASTSAARAESFDIDCVPVDSDGQPDRTKLKMHVQIDTQRGSWCYGECWAVLDVVDQDQSRIVLRGSKEGRGDEWRLTFDRSGLVLEERLPLSAGGERVWRQYCKYEPFGEFKPYLTREARIKGYPEYRKEDFPRDGKGKKIGGMVGFRMTIDALGQPTTCEVISTSGNQKLDDYTCQILMSKTKYLSARSRSGEAIIGSFESRFHWALPQ